MADEKVDENVVIKLSAEQIEERYAKPEKLLTKFLTRPREDSSDKTRIPVPATFDYFSLYEGLGVLLGNPMYTKFANRDEVLMISGGDGMGRAEAVQALQKAQEEKKEEAANKAYKQTQA